MSKAQVVRLGKEWWEQDRVSASQAVDMIVTKPKPLSKKYYSIQQLATLFGVSYDSIRDECRNGNLNYDRIGKQYRISQEAIDEYRILNKRRVG